MATGKQNVITAWLKDKLEFTFLSPDIKIIWSCLHEPQSMNYAIRVLHFKGWLSWHHWKHLLKILLTNVNLTPRDRTPKKAQDTQRLVCCLPGGLKQKAHSFDVHLIGLNRLHDILSAKMKTILFWKKWF